jgi:hypothetical protein
MPTVFAAQHALLRQREPTRRIEETLEKGRELLKASKGLGKGQGSPTRRHRSHPAATGQSHSPDRRADGVGRKRS